MLKSVLMVVVVISLCCASAWSQQVEDRSKLKGPRQTNLHNHDKSDTSAMLVRNFGEDSPNGMDGSTNARSSSKSSVVNADKTKNSAQKTFRSTSLSLTNSMSRKPSLSIKMPHESAGFGLASSWGNNQDFVKTASLVERKRINSLLMPGTFLGGLGRLPSSQDVLLEKIQPDENSFWKRLEIEVSHSSHIFRLYAEKSDGKRETLYECRIGLGAPEFPTPVGVYYVTHIYDQDPWWIPPPNRAWAAGDSPSQRVYGGTMAPLLKKKPVSVRKKDRDRDKNQEDFVENSVKLEDYGYRFHGTNQPRSIGRNQSHGCVRMLSDDAKKVSSLIKDHVGALDRRESENGPYVVLKAPVKLNLVK